MDDSRLKDRTFPVQDRSGSVDGEGLLIMPSASPAQDLKIAAADGPAPTAGSATELPLAAKAAILEDGSPAATKALAAKESRGKQRVRLRPETRAQMLDRLTNPTISLHEASVILDVCPATVRRYTNLGVLPHERTTGGQRRFRLRTVMSLLRDLESKRRTDK